MIGRKFTVEKVENFSQQRGKKFLTVPRNHQKIEMTSLSYEDNYCVSMYLFCLNHSFVYLLYFCPTWDRS